MTNCCPLTVARGFKAGNWRIVLGVKEKAGTYFTVRGSTFELTQRFAETPLIGPLHINPAHSQSEHKILPQADEMSIGVYNSQR